MINGFLCFFVATFTTEQLCQILNDDIPKLVATNGARTMLCAFPKRHCVPTVVSPACHTAFAPNAAFIKVAKWCK